MTGDALRRVRVAPGRTIHRGASGLPFRPGDLIDLPPDHAEQLGRDGHVAPEADAASLPRVTVPPAVLAAHAAIAGAIERLPRMMVPPAVLAAHAAIAGAIERLPRVGVPPAAHAAIAVALERIGGPPGGGNAGTW